MEQMFEKKLNLESKLVSESKEFYNTGLLINPQSFDGIEISENFKFAVSSLSNFRRDKRCSIIEGRKLSENEKLILLSSPEDQYYLLDNEDACYALGSSLELIDQILSENNVKNGIGFIKSPKNIERGSFESLLGDIVLKKHKLKRILFLNWDTTHNSNLQKRFYNDSRILNVSIHHLCNDSLTDSDFYNIGSEQNGKGYNINIPLSQTDFGDEEYMAAFHNLILPIAYEFNPQLIIISTCFNAVNYSNTFSINAYEHFLNAVSCLANGKICLLVNEKNNSKKFNECVNLSIKALFGYPCTRLRTLGEPNKNLVKSVLNCISVLRPYWYCIQLFNENNPTHSLEDYLKNYIKSNDTKENNSDLKQNDIGSLSSESRDISDLLEDLSLTGNNGNNRTCICSDEIMSTHFNLINKNHPECPERIERIMNLLKERGLYNQCGQVPSRYSTDEELNLCHPQKYIDDLRSLEKKTIAELEEMSINMNSVYYNKKTFECATLSTGSLLSVVDAVCTKKFTNGVAVIRPPGHHANSGCCSGFCFFNSVAVASKYAQKNYKSMKKILILDFDVHHGNGTQDLFEEDDSVLFISLHRYENGRFYPSNAASNYTDVGRKQGKGFTVNIPWNQSNAGDGDYVTAFLKVVLPICYQFNPDLVLVSAGFDAALGDPLGGYSISPSGYSQMTKMLTFFANGNVILALEGGYNLVSISESMCNCVSILLGDFCPSITTMNTKPQAFESLRNVINTHKSFWSCFKFAEKLPQTDFIKKPKETKKNKNIVNSNKKETNYSLRSRIPKNENKDSEENTEFGNSNKTESSKHIYTKKTEIEHINELMDNIREKTDTEKTKEVIVNEKNKVCETKHGEEVPGFSFETEGASGFAFEIMNDLGTAFGVVPLNYCEHLELIRNLVNDPATFDVQKPCLKCLDTSENWICLTCKQILCSRFVNSHMLEHYNEFKHPIVLSFSDISAWCYECQAYIHNPILNEAKLMTYNSKFKE